MRFGMIADDVTGACDAGVQFSSRGFSTQVWLNSNAVPGSAEMTAVSTDTRKDTPEHARVKVTEACRTLMRDGVEIIYKKIDSTLHGNVGAELEAMIDACGCDEVWVAPAFPAMGRTVTAGWLAVNRKPSVHLPTLLEEQGASDHIRTYDAQTQADLADIVQAACRSSRRILLAGSAGLATELADALATQLAKQRRPPRELERQQGPVLFLIGSVNPVTALQVGYLLRRRDAVEGSQFAADALAFGHHAVIHVKWEPRELDCVPELILSGRVRGVVFSGGDTARLGCWLLRAAGIRLDREILTGIPSGTLTGGPCEGLPVATKAGGFGREDALAIVADSLI